MNKIFIHELPEIKSKRYTVKKFSNLAGNSADDTLGLGNTKYACNIRLLNGRISRTYGVGVARTGDYLLPSGVVAGSGIRYATVYKKHNYETDANDDRMIFHLNNGDVYEAKIGVDTTMHKLNVPTADSTEIMNFHYDGEDVLLFFDHLGNISIYDGTEVTTTTGPALIGTSVYNERIYGAEKGAGNTLRWSSNLDPTGWTDITTGAGSIVFPDEGGALRKTLVCGDALYIFRDYAIYRLTGYKDLNDYTLTRIYFSHSPLYPKTIGMWNDKIYFLSEDGFYSVKGTTVSKEWQDEFTLIENKAYAAGVCYGGTYYVAAKLYTDGGTVGDESHCTKNNGILGMMIGTGGGADIIRGVDVADFVPCFINGKSYLFLVNTPGYREMNLSVFTDDGKIYNGYSEIRWASPDITVGDKGEDVTVRKVNIRTASDIKLTVVLSDKEYGYELSGSTRMQTVAVNARGERVKIKITSFAPEFILDGFEIEYETVERRKYGAN